LANAAVADQIWEAWQCEKISNDQAAIAWMLVVANAPGMANFAEILAFHPGILQRGRPV
jgi:hypothetical protein